MELVHVNMNLHVLRVVEMRGNNIIISYVNIIYLFYNIDVDGVLRHKRANKEIPLLLTPDHVR